VLPQVLLTVLVVLSSASFGSIYYYSLAVAGMCLCHVINVLKAVRLYSDKAAAAAAAGGTTAAPLTATAALAAGGVAVLEGPAFGGANLCTGLAGSSSSGGAAKGAAGGDAAAAAW
jgi:hypothetical protein